MKCRFENTTEKVIGKGYNLSELNSHLPALNHDKENQSAVSYRHLSIEELSNVVGKAIDIYSRKLEKANVF